MKYLIGGRVIQVEVVDVESKHATVLMRELSYYAKAPRDTRPDLRIRCVKEIKQYARLACNPSNHTEIRDGYVCDSSHSIIAFRSVDGLPEIEFCYKGRGKSYWRKFRGMQFSHPYEEVGQIFHEAVLMPAFLHFFSGSVCLVHGASLVNHQDEGILFGGTGGVGKTTMELELVKNRGYRFLADDVSILDSRGLLHANHNYPKIYAYNVMSNPSWHRRLFADKSIGDRIWWHLQMRHRAPDRVRRRADPRHFYDHRLALVAPLRKLYMLFRVDAQAIRVRPVDPKIVADWTVDIVKTEFPVFLKHMLWHEYNRDVLGDSVFDSREIFANLSRVCRDSMRNVLCRVVEVPLEYDADRLRNELVSLLEL